MQKIELKKHQEVKILPKFINISHERLCDCKPGHLSCIPAKQWILNQIGVWEFKYEERDIRDKKLHPATFPISMAKRVIEQFTHVGELVLDPFVGSGTTLVAAQDLARNAIGFDLKQEYIKIAESRIMQQSIVSDLIHNCQQIAVCDDARNIQEYIHEGTVKCVFTSPPYANLLNRERKNKSRRGDKRKNDQLGVVEQYSQDPRDLGTLEQADFENAIKEVFSSIKPLLAPKAHCIINITDAWIEGRRVPLHINVIKAMEDAGYQFRNTIIWDRRNIVNQIGIFGWPSSYITMGTTFEYILDFIVEPTVTK